MGCVASSELQTNQPPRVQASQSSPGISYLQRLKGGQIPSVEVPFVNDLCSSSMIRGDAPPILPMAACGCTGVVHRPTCTATDLFSGSRKNWPKPTKLTQPTQPLHYRPGSLISAKATSSVVGGPSGADDDDAAAPPEHHIFSRGNSKLGMGDSSSTPSGPQTLAAQASGSGGTETPILLPPPQAASAPRALITSRALPFTDQMAVNMFLHDSEASLVVDGNCKIVNANFAAYNLFEMNPSADPLKNSNIQLRLSSFPKMPLTANLQSGLWMSDRYIDLHSGGHDQTKSNNNEPARIKQLKWSAWRIDVKDSRLITPVPPLRINNMPGEPGVTLDDTEEDCEERAQARWMVRIKDVTNDEKMNETVHALRQAMLQQKEELGSRAFECVQLREAMLSGRRYRKRIHSTAIIGFLDIQGSTRYDKLDTMKLLEYTRKIVGWSWSIDELSVDQSILKLEMVGDAVVFAFGLFDPILMKQTNPTATTVAIPNNATHPRLPIEGQTDDFKDQTNYNTAGGTDTPESPSILHPVKRLSAASSMSMAGLNQYEIKVRTMLSKACDFLLCAMAEAFAKYQFKLRAGLHMGTVTTSCCGKKMPKLMVIGTPADFASRLQHQGTTGAVHMSAAIARQYLSGEPKLTIGNPVRTQLRDFEPLDTCLITSATTTTTTTTLHN